MDIRRVALESVPWGNTRDEDTSRRREDTRLESTGLLKEPGG